LGDPRERPNHSPLHNILDKANDRICDDTSTLELNGNKKIHNTSRRPSTCSVSSKGMPDVLEEGHHNILRLVLFVQTYLDMRV
jgi:hypothetical protein